MASHSHHGRTAHLVSLPGGNREGPQARSTAGDSTSVSSTPNTQRNRADGGQPDLQHDQSRARHGAVPVTAAPGTLLPFAQRGTNFCSRFAALLFLHPEGDNAAQSCGAQCAAQLPLQSDGTTTGSDARVSRQQRKTDVNFTFTFIGKEQPSIRLPPPKTKAGLHLHQRRALRSGPQAGSTPEGSDPSGVSRDLIDSARNKITAFQRGEPLGTAPKPPCGTARPEARLRRWGRSRRPHVGSAAQSRAGNGAARRCLSSNRAQPLLFNVPRFAERPRSPQPEPPPPSLSVPAHEPPRPSRPAAPYPWAAAPRKAPQRFWAVRALSAAPLPRGRSPAPLPGALLGAPANSAARGAAPAAQAAHSCCQPRAQPEASARGREHPLVARPHRLPLLLISPAVFRSLQLTAQTRDGKAFRAAEPEENKRCRRRGELPQALLQIAAGPTKPGKHEEKLNFAVRCNEYTAIPTSTDLEVRSSTQDPEKEKPHFQANFSRLKPTTTGCVLQTTLGYGSSHSRSVCLDLTALKTAASALPWDGN